MKAAFLEHVGGFDALKSGEIAEPIPGAGEVLVKVHAAGVTPYEFQWFPTFHTAEGQARPFPIVLGHEFSGEVARCGDGVDGLKTGDAIFGMNDWFANGAQAEYCVAPVTAIAPRPAAISHTEAAVTPISALTAWQGLFERGGLKAGQRVLIHGGAGGVGVIAVQLARWRGAQVIATASAGNLEFVRGMGADEAIDYRAVRFEEKVADLDLVFDCVGGETLKRSWAVLRPGGRAVTISSRSPHDPDERARAAFILVESKGEQLAEIASLIAAGTLRVPVEAQYPLDQAQDAYTRAARGGMRGKIALIARS